MPWTVSKTMSGIGNLRFEGCEGLGNYLAWPCQGISIVRSTILASQTPHQRSSPGHHTSGESITFLIRYRRIIIICMAGEWR